MSTTDHGTGAISCANHAHAAPVTKCSNCGFPICTECWTHLKSGRHPWCSQCATEVTSRPFRAWSWVVTFLAISIGLVVIALRTRALADEKAWIALGAVVATGVLGWLVWRASSKSYPTDLALRSEHDEVPEPAELSPHPYRARLRHVTMRLVPRVSGTAATLMVLMCLGLCAVLFPVALRLPRWVEAEVVFAAWWFVLTTVLTSLLYRGLRVADDFRFRFSRGILEKIPGGKQDQAADPKATNDQEGKKLQKPGWLDGCSGGPDEGCAGLLLVIMVVGAVFGAAWLVAEFVIPAFFMACYALLTRALSRVANDRHECAGHWGRSIGWGAIWSTAYVIPLATVSLILHVIWNK